MGGKGGPKGGRSKHRRPYGEKAEEEPKAISSFGF